MTTHDSSAAAGRRAAVRDREDAVVERLRALSTVIDGEPDPAFRAATRQRLVAMAAVRTPQPVPEPRAAWRRLLAVRAPDAPPAPWRGRLTAGLAAAALAVTAVATLVAVSTGARPGDVLYGLKRGTEQTQLALAGQSRGQTLLDLAGTRLAEVRSLGGGGNAALVISTLHTMDQQTTEGAAWLTRQAVQDHSSAPVHALSAWTTGQRAELAAAQSSMPSAARSAAAASLDLLGQVSQRVGDLTTALACPSGPATSGTDALGPVPGTCPSVTQGTPGSGAATAQTNGPAQAGTSPGTVPSVVPGTGTGTGGGSAGSAGSTGGPVGGSVPAPPTGGGGVLPGPVVPGLPTVPSLPAPELPGAPAGGGTGGSGSGPLPGLPLPSLPVPTPSCLPLVTC